jgi:hypothetical protein
MRIVAAWIRPGDTDPTPADRTAQLERLSELSHQIAATLRANGQSRPADLYEDLADAADTLLRDGFTQRELSAVSTMLPNEPSWLDPRAVDYNAPRAAWQNDLVAPVTECRRTALDLRTLRDL